MNRISEARRARGLTQQQLADLLDTTNVSVGRYEKEDQRLTLPLLRKIAERLETSVSALVGEIDDFDALTPDDAADQVGIPVIDIRASAGGGAIVSNEQRKDVFRFSRSYLETIGVMPAAAAVIEVQGDSMEPTLRSGDRIMVDTSDKNPARPGIFVLYDSDATVVKRVEKVPGSANPIMLVLISDNPVHEKYTVPAEQVSIGGRVVWFARRT